MSVTPKDDEIPEPGGLDGQIADARAAAGRDTRNHSALVMAACAALPADPALALALAREALPLADNSFDSLRAISGIFGVYGDRDMAIVVGRAAVALRPDDSEARVNLGGLLLAQDRLREAAAEFAAHVNLPGATSRGWFLLSVALHRAGEVRSALRAAGRALDHEPADTEPALHYAGLLGSVGRYGDAVGTLTSALAAHPGEPRVWRALSGMQAALGELPEALASAEQATALAPDDAALAAHRDHIAGELNLGRSAPADDLTRDWLVRPERRPARVRHYRPASLPERLRQRWRAIHALLLWEMRSRYARSRLGYFWGVVEPLGHILTIGLVFSLVDSGHPPIGNDLFVFYFSGVCPYLMFGRVTEDVANALHSGKTALQLPAVRTIDLVMARSLMMFATELFSMSMMLSLFALLGRQAWPNDFNQSMLALCMLWLFGTGVGMANMVVREFASSWEFIWQALVRLLYFASGIYYSPIAMPSFVRNILVWNPILQGIEWYRSGFFKGYEPPWLDRSYLVQAVLLALLLGLALERAARARLLRHAAA